MWHYTKNHQIIKISDENQEKTFKLKFLKFWSFISLPWGHVMPHPKFGPDQFSRFDVYWIQTNRQTPGQAKVIYRY